MTLLDANALISLLRREPGGPEVAELLRRETCAMPASCLVEVVDRMIRFHGAGPGRLGEHLGALLERSVGVLDVDSGTAWRAGELRADHYHRKTCALSLADCVLLATAGPEDEVATSDASLAAIAYSLDIGVIALPDSRGRRQRI